MMLGHKHRLTKTTNLRNMLKDRADCQRQPESIVRVDSRNDTAEAYTHPETGEDNVLPQAERAPLARSG